MAIIEVFPGGSINAAVAIASAGDVIIVHDGVYNETVALGGGDSFIRIIARNPHKAILDSNNTRANGFATSGVSGVEINGFLIRNYTNAGVNLDGNHNRIVNNRIQNTNFGIFSDGEGNLLWRNDINQVGNTGIEMEGGVSNWIVQNKIQNAAMAAIDFDDSGRNAVIGNVFHGLVDVDGIGNLLLSNQIRNATVLLSDPHNVFIQNHIQEANEDGIRIDNATDENSFIAENKITGNQQSGIEIPSDFNIIENNEIEENGDSGILILSGATGNLILRNELDDNEPRNVTDNGVNNNYVQNDFD